MVQTYVRFPSFLLMHPKKGYLDSNVKGAYRGTYAAPNYYKWRGHELLSSLTLITTLKWNVLPLSSSSLCYLQLLRASTFPWQQKISVDVELFLLCIVSHSLLSRALHTPKLLICILFSSPPPFGSWLRLDACAGWNSGFLVSITWFNACNCTKKTQFGNVFLS